MWSSSFARSRIPILICKPLWIVLQLLPSRSLDKKMASHFASTNFVSK